MQDQISDYETMAFNDGTLWVQEIDELNGGESLRFSLKFAAQQNVEFRLDNEENPQSREVSAQRRALSTKSSIFSFKALTFDETNGFG